MNETGPLYRSRIDELHLQLSSETDFEKIDCQKFAEVLSEKKFGSAEFYTEYLNRDATHKLSAIVENLNGVIYTIEFRIVACDENMTEFTSEIVYYIDDEECNLSHRIVETQPYGISGRDLFRKSLNIINYLRLQGSLPKPIDEVILTTRNLEVVRWAEKDIIGFTLENESQRSILESAAPVSEGPTNAEFVKVVADFDSIYGKNGVYIFYRDDYYRYHAQEDKLDKQILTDHAVPFKLVYKLDPLKT